MKYGANESFRCKGNWFYGYEIINMRWIFSLWSDRYSKRSNEYKRIISFAFHPTRFVCVQFKDFFLSGRVKFSGIPAMLTQQFLSFSFYASIDTGRYCSEATALFYFSFCVCVRGSNRIAINNDLNHISMLRGKIGLWYENNAEACQTKAICK